MKKFFALLLTLSLLCCAALAETTSLTNVVLPLPEGAEIVTSYADESYYGAEVHKDGVANVMFIVAPSEIYDGQSLADLSEEDLKDLTDLILEDMADGSTCALETTPSGNQYLMIRERGEGNSNIILTVYRGYFIQLTQFNEDFSELTDADEAFLLDLFHALDIPVDAQ